MTDAADPLRLQRLSEALIDAARRAGADQADALAVDGRSVSIDMRARALEQAERAEGLEIGLRVLVGGRQAAVSSSDHRDAAIVEMAARAVAMAREAPVDDHLGLADPGQLARHRDVVGRELADDAPEPEPQHLQDLAQRAEAAALDVAGISQVEAANASYSQRRMWLAASNGFSGGYARTGHSLSVVAITGEGLRMERDYAGESRTFAADLPTPEEFDLVARYIPDEKIEETVIVTDSVDHLVGRLREFEELGFDEIYLHHVSQDQLGFLEMAEQELLPALARG